MRFFIVLLTFACGFSRAVITDAPTLNRYSFAQIHMGVPVRLVVYAADEPTAERACKAAFRRIAQLDDALSDYQPDSETNRLCRRAGGPPVPVGDDLFIVLKQALEVAARSDGAFDPTIGPLVRLWRTARKSDQLPSDQALTEARSRVGWRKVRLDEAAHTVELTAPGMQLDFGGIAKGYAADGALAVLKQHGLQRAYLEAGGDIVVGDTPPGETGWRIEFFDQPTRLTLINSAISTSGDTEQFVEIGGQRYSHIVDPRTGLGLTNRIAVTVTASRGIVADALSTAISVLGEEKGRALAHKYRGTKVFVRKVVD